MSRSYAPYYDLCRLPKASTHSEDNQRLQDHILCQLPTISHQAEEKAISVGSENFTEDISIDSLVVAESGHVFDNRHSWSLLQRMHGASVLRPFRIPTVWGASLNHLLRVARHTWSVS